MIPYILIVEDDDDFVHALESRITSISSSAKITIARSRDAAIALVESQFFDFAILDLSIPTQDGALDTNSSHGKLVFQKIRRTVPGTKILVLTGSQSEDFTSTLLREKQETDIWSEGKKTGTIEFLRKIDFEQFTEVVRPTLCGIQGLDDIELNLEQVQLVVPEDRLVRIFSKKFNATRCIVSSIRPGLSGAFPLRLQLFDQNGTSFQTAIAKLASLERIEDEDRRFELNVALLNAAATPRKMCTLRFGAGNKAALFYQVADGQRSLFETLSSNDQDAAEAVEGVRVALSGWVSGPEKRVSIGEVRKCWVDDEIANAIFTKFGLTWAANFEQRFVQTQWKLVHGDLHGDNVLVSDDNRPMLIDFGDIRQSCACYDPLTLELSAVLQSNPTLSEEWPSLDQCRAWNDLDVYLDGSSIPAFVRKCRTWAEQCAAGKRDVAAAAYSYLLRQLKYEDTRKDRVIALLEGVQKYMQDT